MTPRDIPADTAPAPLPAATRRRPPIWLLVAMIGLGPFTMQIVVPSLPAMARDLNASIATIQLTVTLYLLAVGFGQLIYGPLSDRFGRRPLLMGGLALYAVASLAAALSVGVLGLVVARSFQAIGACAGVVLARAVIRDVWSREEATSVLGYVTMGMTIAPMLAPILGSLLEQAAGWRATMLACLAFALPLAAASWFRLPETLAAPQKLPGLAAIWGAYRGLWAVPSFRAYAALTASSTAVFFAFLGGAPYVVVQGMGYSPVAFALAFAAISIAFALGNWIAGRFAPRLGALRLLEWGVAVCTGGALLATLLLLLLPPHILVFFLPMALVAVGNGMTQPSSIAGALSARPQLAGTASSLVGAMQMGFGALMSFVVGLVEFGAGIGTGLTMAGCGVGAYLALRAVRRVAGR
ncbi:Bcr/CflA family drug resistance efflux transporter [Falsiroseomonas bella]|uniref:Bcr/CflA family efflux transporter n=1 Tax=Falsiroseomonas bella TaxID=2184016 RepID=A0A317FHR1_9PROT|nr:multidrug effflux MFS transporter [Falsiroseomonas bella]PWS38325.1 Bcr/CflA family drug resistance efflux transporter [Falsiroseomonas bella]